jgi:hypothetical protein
MESESEGEEAYVEGTVGEKVVAEKGDELVKVIADPRLPSEKEVEKHCLTHLPYRNWCAVCVAGKGKDLDHRKCVKEERGLPEFSFDYCFPGDDFGYRLTILVGRERTTGMTFATTVPEKGSKGKFVADRCLEFFVECGFRTGDIVIKSDQEPAIKLLVKDLAAERGSEPGHKTLIEESPVQSSGSNGVVERAVQGVEGQVRVLKLALEERIGAKVPASHCIVTFLAEYSAYLLNRLEVGKDGKTAWERSRGKSGNVMGIEFGEKVMFKKKKRDKGAKIDARWEKGIFVGARPCSGEFWIAMPSGIRKCRSVRRLPIEERWGLDSLAWVKHVPWHLYRGDSQADGDIPEDNAVEPEALPETSRGNSSGIVVKMKTLPPRNFQIRKEDAEKHGYSRGCAGCSSWFRGLGRQPHSEECRARFEKLLKDDARFQNAQRRRQEFEQKVQEKAAKKARKAQDEQPRPQVQEGGASSSSGAAGASARAEGGMEVEPEHPRPEADSWEELLRRVKKQKTDEPMDVSAVECWCRDLLAEVARAPKAPDDEIHEARAEIIEMINAKLWSSESGECLKQGRKSGAIGADFGEPGECLKQGRKSGAIGADFGECLQQCRKSGAIGADFGEPGECLKTLEGQDLIHSSGIYSSGFEAVVRSIVDGSYSGDLPDIDGIVEVFGIDVSKSFGYSQSSLPDIYSGDFVDGRSRPAVQRKHDSVSAVLRKSWADFENESAEDLESYVREYWDEEYAMDDVHGGQLDLSKVREARSEEVEFMKSRGIWREVPLQECWDTTGKPPVSVKWVDTMKQGGLVRSRLVARDFKTKGEKDREDLFAATPPLELLKAQLSRAASKRGRKVLVIDVKKAHLYPRCEADVFIELPSEAKVEAGRCGKLVHWLYGFRPAAQAWESHYSSNLEGIGFKRGLASPVSFYSPESDVSCLVHGDDFTFVGEKCALDFVEAKMKQWYELKVKARLGDEPEDDKETDILGRIVRCTEHGFEYEADPRHREKIIETLGFSEKTKGLSVNGRLEDLADAVVELEASERTPFRALAARMNYLAQDAPEVQFAAKEVCREMARPTRDGWRKLKILARFILERAAVVWQFAWQDEVELVLRVFSDSDWAGCRKTRRSTSGGVLMLGSHCLKTWSSTQAPIALSSAEAEYYAMVEATTRAVGLRAMLLEVGVVCSGPTELHSDSSAARGFASRKGVGKMRHLEVRHLWLQAEVSGQRVVLRRVAGEANPADLLTKYLGIKDVFKHLGFMNLHWISRNRITSAAEGGCRENPTFQTFDPSTEKGEGQ